jgi:DNA-binding transcriptional MocR family regulator
MDGVPWLEQAALAQLFAMKPETHVRRLRHTYEGRRDALVSFCSDI